MNREELIELLDAVDRINEEIIAKMLPAIAMSVKVEYSYDEYSVEWADNVLWYSGDDDREWIDNAKKDAIGKPIGDYEPWDNYLRRKINELVADIAKIKL